MYGGSSKFIKSALVTTLLVALIISSGCARKLEGDTSSDPIGAAWKDFRLGEFKRAIATFELVLQNTAETDHDHLQALYGLATTWNLRRPDEDPDLAREYYEKILEIAPDHDLAAWSMLALARMKHLVPVGQDPDYDEVRAAYQEVIARYPGHLAAHEAFMYYQSTYVATLDEKACAKAVEALVDFIEKNPDSSFVSAAYSLMSVGYDVLDEPEKRLDAELKAFETAEVDPTNPFQDNAWRYWMLAALAEFNVGDFETARYYYRKLIEEYPTDIKVYPSEQALERMDRIEAQIREELEAES